MLDHGVIAAASQTLKEALNRALSEALGPTAPKAVLFDLLSDNPPDNAVLSIFLFDVSEDPSARNHPRMRGVNPPNVTVQKPPMALSLRYLLTPWGGNRVAEQQTLGIAMQRLYDHAILSGQDLQPGLDVTDVALKISLCPLTLEERTRVWHAVHQPYRLSVAYEVRVVPLVTTTREEYTPVSRRSLAFTAPEGAP